MVLWGSLSLASALLKAQLIDRVRLRICPVAVGRGTSFFPADEPLVKTRLVREKRYDLGVLIPVYELDAV